MRQSPSSTARTTHRRHPTRIHRPLHTVPTATTSPSRPQQYWWAAGFGVLAIGAIAAYHTWIWYQTVNVIAILGIDVSNSGLEQVNPDQSIGLGTTTIGEAICRTQTQVLKPNDWAIDIPFADTTETTRNSQVRNTTQMFPRCSDYGKQHRPATIGNTDGTSPIRLLDRIQTQVDIQRKSGNQNPLSIVVWLQAAEPGPGVPRLDLTVLGEQIKRLTEDRGRVTIIGPVGQLKWELEQLSAKNPALQVCSFDEQTTCIRDTFDAARKLPKTAIE